MIPTDMDILLLLYCYFTQEYVKQWDHEVPLTSIWANSKVDDQFESTEEDLNDTTMETETNSNDSSGTSTTTEADTDHMHSRDTNKSYVAAYPGSWRSRKCYRRFQYTILVVTHTWLMG